MATIPEIEARIHALWTKGEARTREESVALGQLLTARDAQRFMQQSRASQGAAPEGSQG
jgi:hypothetical protein